MNFPSCLNVRTSHIYIGSIRTFSPPYTSSVFSLHPPLDFVFCLLLCKEGVCRGAGDFAILRICSRKCLTLLVSKHERTEGKEATQNGVMVKQKQNSITENGNVPQTKWADQEFGALSRKPTFVKQGFSQS